MLVENIVLEDTPLLHQSRIFQQAKIVIAQHGASLSNIIFISKIY